MKDFPIADLHCDLLCYLAGDSKRSPYDHVAKCSIPQLQAGNVKSQVMAIFVETINGSAISGEKQKNAFKKLLDLHFDVFERIQLSDKISDKIGILPAIENASAFCEEGENIELALQRFTQWQNEIGRFAYVSLTWNGENRFGGGAHSRVGLKEDGKRLLEYLSEKKIPIDFSHSSDYFAYDILNFIEKHHLQIDVLASHSNTRAKQNVPRNLPDDIIKEILLRHGIIGINFYRQFLCRLGNSADSFSYHLEHFMSLGAQHQLCFGADFFFPGDLPIAYRKNEAEYFIPNYEDASCYPRLLNHWNKQKVVSEETLKGISWNNFKRFYNDATSM